MATSSHGLQEPHDKVADRALAQNATLADFFTLTIDFELGHGDRSILPVAFRDTTLLDRNPDPTETEARYWLAGNLCRCTGYDKVIRAVLDAAAELRGNEFALQHCLAEFWQFRMCHVRN
jgi:hypothetical protein